LQPMFTAPRKIFVILTLGLACLSAQGADWLTDGGNSQRTNWQKDEKILSTATAKNMSLLWQMKLPSAAKQMHNLFPPLVINSLNTSSGPRQVAIVAGVDDNLFAIDVEKGEVIWKKHFESNWTATPGGRGAGILCPGGQTATPVIAPTAAPGKYTIYAASWDGRLRQLNAADGEDIAPPMKWMPPNGKPYGLNLYKNVLYTHTAQGCGGNPNVVYAYDLATNKVGTWGPAGGGMWGRQGPAISADGVMYTGTGDGKWDPENGVYGNGIIGVKQNPQTKSLDLVDYYGPANAEWLVKRDLDMQVTPVIFNFKGKELMIDASKECRLYMMDTKAIGGDDHRTPEYRTPLFCNEDVNFASAGVWGSLASWEDAKGTRWVLSPFWGPKHAKFKAPIENGETKFGAIIAFKVEDKAGKSVLTPAWISRDMNHAEPPLIANGVVYAYGNGEDTDQAYPDVGLDDVADRRIPGSTHAVLYALDAQTGKELWSSGDQIKSWNHFSGITVANGRVYIGTFDGMLYCFGIKK
jgi:outer membrane protein assembly factor BamB